MPSITNVSILTKLLVMDISIATFKHLVNSELIPKLLVIPDLKKNIYYSTKNYELIGFKEIEAYRYNPLQDAMYMELDL